MMIVRQDNTLLIGKDLVDCTTGKPRSHGKVTIRGIKEITVSWQSTGAIAETERAIRAAAKQDYKRVSYFESQAISE
jgi:hypothetical protein